jgi:aspartate ammonia-lyase
MMMMRQERDSLGTRDVPSDAYYGIQTLRAAENFPVSGRRERPELIRAYAIVKKAAALANMDLGVLDRELGGAIVKAADELYAGKFADQFPVDIYQAGAGTSFNMNVNEVIANRALEILGRPRGDYDFMSPNDHVNLAQSTNDTFPTASHIAIITDADRLIADLNALAGALTRKGCEFDDLTKTGRTHLMDALPVTLGDEFHAYAAAVTRAAGKVQQRRDDLLEVAIGGTATGTGENAHPDYRVTVIRHLRTLTSFDLRPARDSFEALQSRSQMAAFSGSLRELALELIRIANDLRLMNSGSTAGLDEITLTAVQPGSSIMPGKVNPVMAECLDMLAFEVIGHDTTVALAAQAGQFELNVTTAVMVHNILESISIFTNYLPVFSSRCIDGIVAHEACMRAYVGTNPILATLLTPKIGYLHAAGIAKEAMEKRHAIRDLAVEKGILTVAGADELFDLTTIAKNHYRDINRGAPGFGRKQ